MDPELFLDFANTVKGIHMFPYFDIAHYALSCIHVRDDMTSSVQLISRKHPLACWISSMVSCFAGYIIANFLLGEMVLAPFKNLDNVGLATLVWYLIFYSPFDVVYKMCKMLPVKATLSVMKEIQRVHKVYHGVEHAALLYPHAYLVQVIIGTVKGAGAGFTKIFERFIRGTWTPTGHEFLQPTFPTKACLAASVLFVVEAETEWITAPHSMVYLGVVIFFVYFKLSGLVLHMNDPFQPIENLFCAVFMGGVWDALSRAVQVSREKAAEKAANGEVDKKNK
ncbi:trimeric intracellular cation channel type 1B.1-like [Paramacrobiotus metropolitanus]|uniref:trimeric intracellular cation channel type 1B.1-like n=1 Tax=Paramacrobiotus metropolitanus TaxID=2943436 RepID=UPI002445F9AA|nr:trimeric intracellular cation channel type 1B.1-like [Paramacrobiotus metropolitanus]XP_055351298.1 trimeric intracellular cation channel type 1B.1-like [Paramacrobiotus metropolitanus]